MLGLLLTALPFAVVAWLTRKIIRESGDQWSAWILFGTAIVVLFLNCAWGYFKFEAIAEQKKWTAASLALARMMYQGLFIAAISWGVADFLIRKRQRPHEHD